MEKPEQKEEPCIVCGKPVQWTRREGPINGYTVGHWRPVKGGDPWPYVDPDSRDLIHAECLSQLDDSKYFLPYA